MQSEVHWPDAPIELGEVMPDRESVVALLERNAPYLPLGGWFRPDQDDDSPTSRMWFQKTLKQFLKKLSNRQFNRRMRSKNVERPAP